MGQMMRHLHINVMSKKTKNIEVVHLAAEVSTQYHISTTKNVNKELQTRQTSIMLDPMTPV